MYTNPRSAARAYVNVGLETGVSVASPHQLIVMLYEGAELSIRMAIKHLNEGDIAKKCAALSKASHILVDGLRASLDLKQGGEIAQQLDSLYEYMNQRLMLANINNQTAPLEEVLGLLRELHEAWRQIGAQAPAAASAAGGSRPAMPHIAA
ncbi:flagellar protein FliS [Thiobacillus denitrificans ATCC 25259]|uniref:Flagellar secretion chaperone FliS n=1 Tax=Thiobacillus denitrificans (strain ATCC 25259 / T1) TaxID=292415 RepID=Q3SII2_THIDA|nr:flagellar export chaperone FliS [Thiobacillus denitrificans]AAZ97546.1 flagellar protein FliS [Thiobacillus denitrificans ATCC 25259]